MTAYHKILEPGTLGGLTTKNRISLSPMEKNWGDRLGNPSQAYVDYLAVRAENGVGMMNIEATYIDPRGRGNLFQLGLWSDDNIPSHARINEAVKAHGCRTSAELNHGGRNSNTHRTGLQPVGPSNLPSDLVGGHQLKVLTTGEIASVVEEFAAGARRAVEAGYDIITIHGAHGYLITSFLSHVYNQRTDEYGGNDENCWRFPTEVYQAIRSEVGPDMPVGMRISAFEDVEGGYTIDYSSAFINHLAGLGLDFVDVSAGLYESMETLIQPMDLQQGYLLPIAHQMKDRVSIPVISSGRVNDMDIAERAVSSGDADFVHMSRAFHADPEILVKTMNGRKDEVIGCIACNKCCMELFVNKPSVCAVNPATGRERFMKLTKTNNPKRVMVVGGGLSGMEAAAIAAQRGHTVTLYEKTEKCGGFVNILRAPRNRLNWGRAAEDRIRMMDRAGVKVVTSKAVTVADIEAEKPEVLVLATGTKPFMPLYISGIDEEMVTNYDDVIRGRVDAGVNVVVVGGQNVGITTAEFLAERGAEVTVIEPTGEVASDVEFMARKVLLRRLEETNSITVRLNSNVESIAEDSVLIQSHGETETLEDVDQVVFAVERDRDRGLIEAVSGGLTEQLGIELHAIGDAVWPREPYDVVYEGSMVGRAI